MIVDIHVHLGWDYTFDENFSKEELIKKMKDHGIDVQIVQPGTCHDLATVRSQHNAIAKLCKTYPGRFFGMSNPPPHLPSDVYMEEVARCVEKLEFTSIKLHPMASAVNPDSRSGRKAFEAARKYRIPVMVHTGSGFPFSDPLNLLGIGKEYHDIKIIMAHCGMMVFAGNASKVLASLPNVYGDSSWTPGFLIKEWARTYGPRVMFASDHADNTEAEITKIKTCGLKKEEEKAVLGGTAIEVFNLKERLP